jgi:hypothetical protein
MRFLITGLPRSRTAWMATLVNMSCADAVCIHEPLSYMKRWQDIGDLWGESKHGYFGFSDSALGFHLKEIMETWRPQLLVVERDIDDATRSLESIGVLDASYCRLLNDRLLEFKRSAGGFHDCCAWVPFKSLTNMLTISGCLDHLLPGAKMDYIKAQQMQWMNVQCDREHAREIAKRRMQDAADLLGKDVLECLSSLRAVT